MSTGKVIKRKSGRELKMTTVMLPIDLYTHVRRVSDSEGRQMSAIISEALRQWLAGRR